MASPVSLRSRGSLLPVSPTSDSSTRRTKGSKLTQIFEKLRDFSSPRFYLSSDTFRQDLAQVRSQDIRTIFEKFIETPVEDPMRLLERLTQTLPAERERYLPQDAMKKVIRRRDGSEFYLKTIDENASLNTKSFGATIKDGFVSVLDSFITAIGILDFFSPSENQMQGFIKSQRIVMLLTLFSAISSMLVNLFGAATGGLVFATVLITIILLSAIWPYFKPLAAKITGKTENLTNPTEKQDIMEVSQEILEQIARAIANNEHVMLLGPSRFGKTSTLKAFAQAIKQGKFRALENMVVYHINTPEITGNTSSSFMGGGNTSLAEISANLGPNSSSAILGFDEIQAACKPGEGMHEALKTFLDKGGKFKHVIAITTQDEFDEYISGKIAFCNRFTFVHVKKPEACDVLKTMNCVYLRSSRPIIDKGVMQYIYEQTSQNDAPQPMTALNILTRCVSKTENTQRSELEKRLTKIDTDLNGDWAKDNVENDDSEERLEQIERLKAEKLTCQQELTQQREKIAHLFKIIHLRDRVIQEKHRTVLQLPAVFRAEDVRAQEVFKKYLIINAFERFLEAYIRRTSQELGVQTVISRALVDKELAEFREGREKKGRSS